MYVSGDGYKKLPGRSFPARAPWLGSLKRDWSVRPIPTEWSASGGMTGVDYMPALFGFARMRPDIFSKFPYPLGDVKGRKKCEAALFKPIAGAGWGLGEMNDGRLDTRGGGKDRQNDWVAVDLQEQHMLESVSVHWEVAKPNEYDIQFGPDGKKWTTAATVQLDDEHDGNSKTKVTSFGAGMSTRWIRISMRAPKTVHGFSIWEISACGFPVNTVTTTSAFYTAPTTATAPTTTTSTTHSPGHNSNTAAAEKALAACGTYKTSAQCDRQRCAYYQVRVGCD